MRRPVMPSPRRIALWPSTVGRYVAHTIRDGERQQGLYESQAWVIMPNHVHLLILPQLPLPRITHWIKGRTAREANRSLGRAGAPFRQHESYDSLGEIAKGTPPDGSVYRRESGFGGLGGYS
jgi:REP element-mobilizing transposase RayT